MSIKEIIKRDGRIVPFDESKISAAINKAFIKVGLDDCEKEAEKIAKNVVSKIDDSETPTVEGVQDIVEKELMASGYSDVAKEYVLYRAERTKAREMKSKLMQSYKEIAFVSSNDSTMKRENANINAEGPMGKMLKYGSEGSKDFYLKFVMSPEHAQAHINGDIHVHDLDFASTKTTTCCQIDLTKLFENGFHTGHGYLREPNSISSYGALAAIAIQASQCNQHGGQSIPSFDYDMVPGVKKSFNTHYRKAIVSAIALFTEGTDNTINFMDEDVKSYMGEIKDKYNEQPGLVYNEKYVEIEKDILISRFHFAPSVVKKIQKFAYEKACKDTDRETYQTMEAFIHNLNTMASRAGAQVPFSSINFGTETSEEGRIVIKNFLLATDAGLGHSETPIFPVSIFRVKEGINYNPEDPNYDLFKLAMKVSAKRLFPKQNWGYAQ